MREGFKQPGTVDMGPTRAEQLEKERVERIENLHTSIDAEPARYLSAEALQHTGVLGMDQALERIEQTGDKVVLDEGVLSKLIAMLEKRGDEESAELVGRIKKVTGTESAGYKFPRKSERRIKKETDTADRKVRGKEIYDELLRNAGVELGQSEPKEE